jgi:hypothetical protein
LFDPAFSFVFVSNFFITKRIMTCHIFDFMFSSAAKGTEIVLQPTPRPVGRPPLSASSGSASTTVKRKLPPISTTGKENVVPVLALSTPTAISFKTPSPTAAQSSKALQSAKLAATPSNDPIGRLVASSASSVSVAGAVPPLPSTGKGKSDHAEGQPTKKARASQQDKHDRHERNQHSVPADTNSTPAVLHLAPLQVPQPSADGIAPMAAIEAAPRRKAPKNYITYAPLPTTPLTLGIIPRVERIAESNLVIVSMLLCTIFLHA